MKIVMTKVTIVLSLMTLFAAFVFYKRLTLPYNTEGRCFDESSVIVYQKQAIIGYGFRNASASFQVPSEMYSGNINVEVRNIDILVDDIHEADNLIKGRMQKLIPIFQ